jgi:hypothetical protein
MTRFVAGAAVLALGCAGARGPRAIKPAIEEHVAATPAAVFQAAVKAVTDQGLPLREADPVQRVVQTNYVDIQTFDPLGAAQYPVAERLVRFRILVATDPQGPGSVVALVAVYAPFRTGFSTSERNERAIPRDHPGMKVARDIWADIQAAAGRS